MAPMPKSATASRSRTPSTRTASAPNTQSDTWTASVRNTTKNMLTSPYTMSRPIVPTANVQRLRTSDGFFTLLTRPTLADGR